MSSATPRPRFEPRRVEISRLFDKEPPQALEAEVAVLGSVLLDAQVMGEVMETLSGSGDFSRPGHAAIYEVLVDLYDRNEPITMVALHQRLKDLGQLEQVGGLDYLVTLAESAGVPTLAGHFARIVREKATLRRLIEAAGKILDRAYNTADPVSEMLDQAEQDIFALAETGATGEASDLASLLHETLKQIEERDGRVLTGVETGFLELDDMTSGFQPGEMIIIAARPSMGKTALALNVAEHMAVSRRVPVAFFSLEMSKQQLAQRLLCSHSGVDSHRLRRNTLRDDEMESLRSSAAALEAAPLYIDDTPGLSILALRSKARRMRARHNIQAVFIDYLQLVSGSRTDSREQEVSSISRGIKALARELRAPVVCLSQLNRGPEAREGHRPRMSDLRESGSIEQDADVVLMLHREDYYHRGDAEHSETNVAELIIAKQRNGPTGTVKMQFNSGTTRFNNLAFTTPPPGM